MDEMQYYKEVYSKFWANQTKVYGYEKYTKGLVKLIAKSSPRKVFEVGIGTGWPIGAALKKKGIKIDGCDVAESSVALAKKELNNDAGIWVGEVQEYGNSGQYDVTYCVRVSWYIPCFYQTVEKMISMTKPGGYVIFDVMDKNSLYCLNLRLLAMKEKYYRLLGIEVDDRYGAHFISIRKMENFLKKKGVFYQYWTERKITHSEDKFNTPKIVFYCKKEK